MRPIQARPLCVVPDPVARADQAAAALRRRKQATESSQMALDSERVRAAAAEGDALDWSTFKFGAFKFTAKKPKIQAQWSWQVKCPFHKKK